jgi:AcrR family transcriptional regulator
MAETRSISERLATIPPGRHLEPRDFVVQSQRERMLLATAELVADRGYRRTTIELIARTARVALTTFYEHFESKEQCFLAAFDESVDAAGEVFAELVDPELDWTDQISTGLEVLLEMVVTETPRATLCLVEAQAAGPAALARYQEMLERLAPKLREGRALNPRSARLPDGLEVAIAGGIAWLIHQRLVAGEAAEIKALLPEMLQIALTPYVGEVEAGRAADAAGARVAA